MIKTTSTLPRQRGTNPDGRSLVIIGKMDYGRWPALTFLRYLEKPGSYPPLAGVGGGENDENYIHPFPASGVKSCLLVVVDY